MLIYFLFVKHFYAEYTGRLKYFLMGFWLVENAFVFLPLILLRLVYFASSRGVVCAVIEAIGTVAVSEIANSAQFFIVSSSSF